ncbi:MAG: TonB family protein [Crocinitomicaceae bacterium]
MKYVTILLFCMLSVSLFSQGEIKPSAVKAKKNVTYLNKNHFKVKSIKEAVFYKEEYQLSKDIRIVKEFSMDSVLMMEGKYTKGRKLSFKNGVFKYYYPNGQLRYTGLYTYDSKQGEWKTFDENGILLRKSEYEKGQRVNYKYYPLEKDTTADNSADTIFNYADKNPQYKGGDSEMASFIGRNFEYPEESRVMGQQGTAFVEFVVGTDGILSDIKIVKGVSDLIDDEVLRIIKAMPTWEPGVKDGKQVKTRFTIPIRCRLG